MCLPLSLIYGSMTPICILLSHFPLSTQLLLEEHVMSSVRSLAKTYSEQPAEDLKLKEMCEGLAAATQEQLG